MSKSKLGAKAPAVVDPGKSKIMVLSKSGIGKTWFSLSFPSPYYIDSEGGARLPHYQRRLAESGGAYFGVEDGALDFAAVIGQVEALATERHQYQTLAIGSITKLYQHTIALEQAKLGDRDAFGASKKPAVSYMRRLVMWLMRLDMNVLLEAHESTEWGINPKTGQREEVGVIADVWDKLIYELDLTLRLEKRGPERVCVVKKSRLTGFPEGESFPAEYAYFSNRYGKDFIERESAPITLATAEQVAEINRLLSVLTIPEKEIERILNKAQADSVNELSAEQADKMIVWMKGKIQ